MPDIFEQELYDQFLEIARRQYVSDEFIPLLRNDVLSGVTICFDGAKLLRDELTKDQINQEVALRLINLIENGAKRVANLMYALSDFDREQRANRE